MHTSYMLWDLDTVGSAYYAGKTDNSSYVLRTPPSNGIIPSCSKSFGLPSVTGNQAYLQYQETITGDYCLYFFDLNPPNSATGNRSNFALVQSLPTDLTEGCPLNQPPAISSNAVATAIEDTVYSYSITTTDTDDLPTDLIITAVAKPPWLSLTDNGDDTATLSGKPRQYNFIDNQSVTLSVNC